MMEQLHELKSLALNLKAAVDTLSTNPPPRATPQTFDTGPRVTIASQFIRLSAADQAAYCLGGGTLTLKEFNLLPSPQAKSSFFKQGGKLADEPFIRNGGHIKSN